MKAQAPAADTTRGWKYQVAGLLNLSQAYYDNWVKGGTDAFAWETNVSGSADLTRDNFTWENHAKAAYGRNKIQKFNSRKSADEWNLETIYTYKLGAWVNPFASAAVNSQFAPGYAYSDTGDHRTQISDFFDPGYAIQTLGAGANPWPFLKERLGGALKETFSSTYGYADDKETSKAEEFKIEPGLSSVTECEHALMENILLASRLEIFANFKGWDEVDIRWENKIAAKVNKIVSANFEFEQMRDKDLNDGWQTRESLSIGIAFLKL